MNKVRQTVSYLLGLSLLLVSQFIFADSSSLSDIAFGSDQVKNYSDISVSYLSQLLGTIGNVLHGTSGQIFGQMFYVFNTGILIAAGIWLCYTVLTILLKSSQEGSFSGQNRNAAVIFLKIALGIAFLVPSPSTGYNVLQAIVAKVVVYGVDLADSVWNKALDYMDDGGTIFSLTPLTSITNHDDGTATTNVNEEVITKSDTQTAIAATQTILSNAVCFYQANSTRTTPASMIVDNDKYQLQFPGPGDDSNATSLANPGCGYVSWDIGGYCTKAANASDNDKNKSVYISKCSSYQQAIYQIVTDLWQTGLSVANYYPVADADSSIFSTSLTKNDLMSEAQISIVNAVIDYINLAMPATRVKSLTDNHPEYQTFYETTARKGGWITAGQFYWNMIQYSEAISKSHEETIEVPVSQNNIDNNDGNIDFSGTATSHDVEKTVMGPDSSVLTKGSNYRTANQSVIDLSSKDMYNSLAGEVSLLDPAMDGDVFKAKQYKFNTNDFKHASAAGAKNFGQSLLSFITDPSGDMYKTFKVMLDTNKNPLIWGHDLGQQMLKTASVYVTTLTVILPFLGFIGGWTYGGGGFVLPFITWMATKLVSTVSSMIKMLLIPVIFICVIGGVMLSFYLPLYPYFIFTFGVATWLINVIEGMVAAPIVALGLTHPEGHDFLGRAEQSLILLLNLFIRPALMVFGLIGGILLSYVLLELVQQGAATMFMNVGLAKFGSTFSPLTLWKAMFSSGYPFLGPLIFVILLSMYIFFIYQVTIKAFSLIYVLPNRILRWIGGFEQQDDSAMLAEQQKGIAVQAGGQGGKMAIENVIKSEDALKKK